MATQIVVSSQLTLRNTFTQLKTIINAIIIICEKKTTSERGTELLQNFQERRSIFSSSKTNEWKPQSARSGDSMVQLFLFYLFSKWRKKYCSETKNYCKTQVVYYLLQVGNVNGFSQCITGVFSFVGPYTEYSVNPEFSSRTTTILPNGFCGGSLSLGRFLHSSCKRVSNGIIQWS